METVNANQKEINHNWALLGIETYNILTNREHLKDNEKIRVLKEKTRVIYDSIKKVKGLIKVKALNDFPIFIGPDDLKEYDGLSKGESGKYPEKIAKLLIHHKLAEVIR